MKLKHTLLLFILGFITSCSRVVSYEEMQTMNEGFVLPAQPSKGMAMVYVVKPEGEGTIIKFNVFLDTKKAESEVGYTRGAQHIYFDVTPGVHKIFSNAENWAEIEIELKDGDIVYIKQNVHIGVIMARNSLDKLDEVEGKYFVSQTETGTILKK